MSGDNGLGPWGQPGNNNPAKPPRGSVPGATPGPGWRPVPTDLPDFRGLWSRLTGGPGGPPGRGPRIWLQGTRGLALMALVLIAIWLVSGFYRVQPDEAGVVQRFGAFARLTPPGLNYHIPWPVESVQLPAVTRINRVEVGYRSANADADDSDAASGARDVPAESLMLTGDENIIDINFAVFWRIADAKNYLFNTRNPSNTIKDVAESVMREVIGRTPIQPALTDARARIEADVLQKSQAILDRYGAGVQLSQVQLLRVDPPAEVIDSFRDVQRANTEAERMVNEAQSYANNIVPRARGDAAVITAGGDADRQAAIAQATGDAKRFDSVRAAYAAAPEITLKRLYIEAMQDVLSHAPAVVMENAGKNLLPLLNLTPGAGHVGITESPGTAGAAP